MLICIHIIHMIHKALWPQGSVTPEGLTLSLEGLGVQGLRLLHSKHWPKGSLIGLFFASKWPLFFVGFRVLNPYKRANLKRLLGNPCGFGALQDLAALFRGSGVEGVALIIG